MTEVLLKRVPGTVLAEEGHQRSASPRIKTVIGRVHRELRAATRNDHALIDRMLLKFDLRRAENYRVFLNIHFAALLTLRIDWRPQDSEDFEQMLRSLQADLETLGIPSTTMPIPASGRANPGSGLGIAYVIRGSRLGAAFLRRGVVGTLSTSYLDFVPALSWAEFLGQLESIADDPNGTDEAIRAARCAFNAFATEFNRVHRVITTPSS
jgi:heme oxygenase (biliverdin-IX-beta and delta-forming)